MKFKRKKKKERNSLNVYTECIQQQRWSKNYTTLCNSEGGSNFTMKSALMSLSLLIHSWSHEPQCIFWTHQMPYAVVQVTGEEGRK